MIPVIIGNQNLHEWTFEIWNNALKLRSPMVVSPDGRFGSDIDMVIHPRLDITVYRMTHRLQNTREGGKPRRARVRGPKRFFKMETCTVYQNEAELGLSEWWKQDGSKRGKAIATIFDKNEGQWDWWWTELDAKIAGARETQVCQPLYDWIAETNTFLAPYLTEAGKL